MSLTGTSYTSTKRHVKTPSEAHIHELRHRNGGGGGGGGSENRITSFGNEHDQEDDMDDPVNRPLGWQRRGHHPSPPRHGGGGGKEHDVRDEEENNDGGERYPSNFVPRTTNNEMAILFKDGRKISLHQFQEETCHKDGLTQLKSFGLEDPNVGAIHWVGTISLVDEDGQLIDLSKVIKFHAEGVVVWRDVRFFCLCILP